jgi:methionine synthase II (cobalamin-independent)
MQSRFQVSKERAQGLYAFTETLAKRKGIVALKGQVTGPFTMLTGIKDREGRAGYFDDTIREMVIKGIAMKAAWQTRFLSTDSDKQVVMTIDEPALAGLGSSAFISVTTAEIQEMVNEVADAIHQANGLAGIHVCANTDWELLLESKIDVLSFDAYSFFDKFAPQKERIHTYLDRGSIIAWGGIPTGKAEDIEKETGDSLTALWESQAEQLTTPDRDKADILRQTFITPSCGTGSLTPELAQKVLALTKSVSDNLRAKYLV